MHYLVPFKKSYLLMRRAPYNGSITSQGPAGPQKTRKARAERTAGIPGAANKRIPAILPRNHRSTLARIPVTHPTPPDANGIRPQSNRSGIISSIALRAFKAFLPFAVVL